MSRTFVTLFFILAISTAAVLSQTSGGPGSCGENEVWSECNGHCQHTCANPNPICTLVCRAGCICESDYLRNKKGECIPKDCCDSSESRESSGSSQESSE